jgi:hypothetical protein
MKKLKIRNHEMPYQYKEKTKMKNIIIYLFIIGLASTGWSQLVVKEGSNTYLKVDQSTGNLGIGIGDQTPSARMDVAGDIRFRSLVQGSLSHPVLTVDADGNLGVVEDQQGSGADGVVTDAVFSGTSSKTLTLTLSDASTVTATFSDLNNEHQDLGSTKTNDDVTVTITDGSNTTFSVQDQDHDPNNEKPLEGDATTISGLENRDVDVRVDNSSIKINNSNQLYAMPSLEMYANTNTPRNILITYSGNSITGVYYKDGEHSGVFDPTANGWTTASSADYEQVTPANGSRTGLGIKISPELARISSDASIKALQVRVGAFAEGGDEDALFFLSHSENPLMKQMGDVSGGGALEANGTIILNSNQEFYLVSQGQSDDTRRLRNLWVTIFGGFR